LAGNALALPSDDEVLFAARAIGDGVHQVDLAVPGVHCGACINTVETALGQLPGVEGARVNLSTKRVSVRWRGDLLPPLVQTLAHMGYPSHVAEDVEAGTDKVLKELVRAVGI